MPAHKRAVPGDQAAVQALRRWSEPLPQLDDPALTDTFDVFGRARVVLLGDATHCTAEFSRLCPFGKSWVRHDRDHGT
jgi:erythromycin esterase-like protein